MTDVKLIEFLLELSTKVQFCFILVQPSGKLKLKATCVYDFYPQFFLCISVVMHDDMWLLYSVLNIQLFVTLHRLPFLFVILFRIW